jgi:alginate O-acetyltransferase complex protein AlgI
VLFPTITFATFFMAVWPITWAVARRPAARCIVLLAASAGFYAYWDWRYLGLLAATVLANVASAHAIHRTRRRPALQRAALWVGVGAHLAVLGWCKYYGFFASSLTSALDRVGITIDPPLVQVVLPLGISFVTFEAISHLIEVRREVLEPGAVLEVATWLSFFPTIASGPITRSSELLPQLREAPERSIEAPRAFALIVRGLFKKMVLASFLATALADEVFARPDAHTGPEVLLGVYAYAVQLYLDFSGYTDIAIGCALLLGLRLPENFNAPYAAASVTEFWTRWHMTLTRWLRDFVFTPLVLHSKRTTAATCRNIVIVMLLAGLWHGAAWTFVAFGLVHGVAMATERVLRQRRRRLGRPPALQGTAGHVLGVFITFNIVCLGWVFFRADSVAAAIDLLARLGTGWGVAPTASLLMVAVVAGVVLVQQLPRRAFERLDAAVASLGTVPAVLALAGGLLVVDVFGPEGVPPFLYFGF